MVPVKPEAQAEEFCTMANGLLLTSKPLACESTVPAATVLLFSLTTPTRVGQVGQDTGSNMPRLLCMQVKVKSAQRRAVGIGLRRGGDVDGAFR